jgi:hypothetical protein
MFIGLCNLVASYLTNWDLCVCCVQVKQRALTFAEMQEFVHHRQLEDEQIKYEIEELEGELNRFVNFLFYVLSHSSLFQAELT